MYAKSTPGTYANIYWHEVDATFLVGKFAFRVPGPMANRATSQTLGFCLQRLHLVSAFIQGEMGADNLTCTFASRVPSEAGRPWCCRVQARHCSCFSSPFHGMLTRLLCQSFLGSRGYEKGDQHLKYGVVVGRLCLPHKPKKK